MKGDEVYLKESDLTSFVHELAKVSGKSPLEPPVQGQQARYMAQKMVHFQQDALEAVAEMMADPPTCGPRTLALVTQLAKGNGVADRVYADTHGQPAKKAGQPELRAEALAISGMIWEIVLARGSGSLAPLLPLPTGEIAAAAYARHVPQPVPVCDATPPPALVRRKKPALQLTLREMVKNHPRKNGKTGFTVRELRPVMNIASDTLKLALDDPFRLRLDSVAGLAHLIGKAPWQVAEALIRQGEAVRKSKKQKPGNTCSQSSKERSATTETAS